MNDFPRLEVIFFFLREWVAEGRTNMPQSSTLRKWGRESQKAQMAPGPFAAEEPTSSKMILSLLYPFFLLNV